MQTRKVGTPQCPRVEAGMKRPKEIRLGCASLAGLPNLAMRNAWASCCRTDPEVKLLWIQGLDKIGTPEIIGPLQFVLTDRNLDIKRAVASALAKVGGQKASSCSAFKARYQPRCPFLRLASPPQEWR